ncbi:GntR family transcriptional regulator [Anaerorhabdus sp.]|uniref:GntR family transcriptional regulator n=1 Tax=Anaerorhabdus sp. TaxID=1872524 RepID=UPI002FC5FD16
MKTNDEKIPKYQIIENDIIDKINNGIYLPNAALPTEAEIAEKYNCSRVTVRQALSNLVFRGFIYKNQGSGTFVKPEQSIQRTPLLKSFSEDILEQGKEPRSVVHTFNITEAGVTMSKILGINETDKIYLIERTRYADDKPVLFERTFMSVDLHPEMSMKILLGSKYSYAEKNGFDIDYAYQTIAPIFPPEYIASELNVSTKHPILRINNPTYLKDGRVFDYTELYLNTDLYQLNIIKKREFPSVKKKT